MDQNNKKISLIDFWAVYAVLEKFDHVPEFHLNVMNFLESEWENNTGVLQVFRNGSKSSIAAAYVVWLLVNDPTLLILIQSADDNTAQKMVSDCRKIINVHPFAVHLRGKNTVWSARGFQVRGATSGRNLSVAARGIMSNVTGARADVIIFDDVEVKKNAETQEMREKIRGRMSESHHLLNPGGRKLFIGTPHSFESIYPELIEKGCSNITIPMLTNLSGEFPFMKGDCVWAERWDQNEILNKQLACKTKAEFYSQYLLIPSNIEDSILDPALIKSYSDDIEVITANKCTLMRIGNKVMSSVACFWDIALSKDNGDCSVVAVVYGAEDGSIYIHRVIEVKGDADEQALKVKDIAIKFQLPLVTIETNGIGGFMPAVLLKHVRGLKIGVVGEHTSMNKKESIRTAYETPISAGFLYAHESVLNGPFKNQLRDFSPRTNSKHDDFIDAPAKAIHKLPIRIGRKQMNSLKGFNPWRPQGEEVEIERDYA